MNRANVKETRALGKRSNALASTYMCVKERYVQMVFMIGDRVSYVGTRFKLSGKSGIIEARVQNQEDTYVCDFGDDAYVMSGSLLSRFTPSQAKEKPQQDHKSKKNNNEPVIKEEKPKEEPKQLFISEDDQSYAD